MSIVHSQRRQPDGQARERRGADSGRSAPQTPSPTAGERLRPAPTGTLRVGHLDARGGQQLGDEVAEDDRLAVGDEVGIAAARPSSAASTRPSTTLSTCVVEVRCLPPPIQAKRPFSTASFSAGRIVVSPGPQTRRGRRTTVSKPSPFASSTACSAIAFVAL